MKNPLEKKEPPRRLLRNGTIMSLKQTTGRVNVRSLRIQHAKQKHMETEPVQIQKQPEKIKRSNRPFYTNKSPVTCLRI